MPLLPNNPIGPALVDVFKIEKYSVAVSTSLFQNSMFTDVDPEDVRCNVRDVGSARLSLI